MKELEKIKRISIASTLYILAIIIGLLTYERPKNKYAINTKSTLEKLVRNDYFVSLTDISNSEYVLIDVRNQIQFDKGHLENAVNIYSPEFLSDKYSSFFKELKKNNKTAVLYGNHPQEVNAPYLFLYQLGYSNLKMLAAENSFTPNEFILKNCVVEKSKADVTAFIKESSKVNSTVQ